jgi:Ca-activated chloride channel homolog
MISWWDNIVFGEPRVLWLLLAVPVLAILMFLTGGRGKPVLRLSSFRYLKGIPVPAKVKWRKLLYVLRLVGLALLIVTFARPQSRIAWKRSYGQGIDIMLCIDVSPSMDAEDFEPNRLEAAKREAINFIDSRLDDRIGVVVFSAETFTLCPLTTDHKSLKNLIVKLSRGGLKDGTAIGMGLAKSVERLQSSKAKSKVVVLLTDGENTEGLVQPIDAGRLAKTYGIKVYVIGLGSIGRIAVPTMKNPDGSYVQQYKESDIDENTLAQISTMTGGKYFRAADERKLENIYKEIDRLEKSDFDKKDREERKEEFLPFLIAALAFFFAELVLRYTTFDSLT